MSRGSTVGWGSVGRRLSEAAAGAGEGFFRGVPAASSAAISWTESGAVISEVS